ncbi:MAG: succinate dehydrogenase/fumarate reductase iron-sulfur subunit [Candidatus Nezhaarchaeota archaeon]|nr:succinate dehydrogenase/fumarate reductase iron-sulfur subunit [Candidatus Nezhaarchaeota archaeon]
MEGEQRLMVKVYRCNPEVGEKPHYRSYEVPWHEGMTVLEVLRSIYENHEPIAFRYHCRSGVCGACGVMVNGRPVLACRTYVEGPGELVIEPLKNFNVIKDLVVDRRPMLEQTIKLEPWLLRGHKAAVDFEKVEWSLESKDKFYLLASCRECYLCRAACPAAEVGFRKPEVTKYPGAKFYVRDLATRLLDPRDEGKHTRAVKLKEDIDAYACTTCKKCWEVCPREFEVPEVMEELRSHIANVGLGPLEGHMVFADFIKKTGRAVDRQATPLVEQVPELIDVANPIDEVLFFTGCLIDFRLQRVGLGIIDVLKRNNVRVIVPKDQQCCGSPAIRSGLFGVGKAQAMKNVEVFERYGVSKVVMGCPGCLLTWKTNYPKFIYEERKNLPRLEVYEITEYLVKILGLDKINKNFSSVDMRVTYHDSCHLRRGCGIWKEPRELISIIPGLKFREMNEHDVCCGSGGGVRAGRRAVSVEIGKRKVDNIVAAEVDGVIMECPFCYIQIRDVLQQFHGGKVKVLYLIELIADAYKGAEGN